MFCAPSAIAEPASAAAESGISTAGAIPRDRLALRVERGAQLGD
jgi:hypothetical protein